MPPTFFETGNSTSKRGSSGTEVAPRMTPLRQGCSASVYPFPPKEAADALACTARLDSGGCTRTGAGGRGGEALPRDGEKDPGRQVACCGIQLATRRGR